jgi:nucleoside-diphosphate-sugar epimerase
MLNVESVLITGGSGYIGSYLYGALSMERKVYIVDVVNLSKWRGYYQDIDKEWLSQFGSVIHLAAHSSVRDCEANPDGAMRNNTKDVFDLIRKLNKNQKFIFASTGSLYDTSGTRRIYDTSKILAEVGMQAIYQGMEGFDIRNLHILRFATVAGVSPFIRTDTILNGMTRDAVKTGVIVVRNPKINRPILTLGHLADKIASILRGKPGGLEPKPLATWNDTVFGWASRIAVPAEARIEFGDADVSYDFTMPAEAHGEAMVSVVIDELIRHWKKEDKTWKRSFI